MVRVKGENEIRCEGHIQKVQSERFLRWTGPKAGGFLSLTGLWPEGCGIAPWAMSIKSALRIHLSVSYGMIGILVIGSLRSPPKGETAEWYMKYMTLCFSSPYFSFPLEGKSREAGKGVRGRAPIGCSIAVLTANRRPPERSDTQRTHFALCELDL